jgi:hypothetical protein
MKKCTVCNFEKNLDNYVKDNYRKDGYDATCKLCKKEQRKKRNEIRKNIEIPVEKKCSLCEQILTSNHFHKKPGSIDGLHTECKNCKKTKRQKKKEKNQDNKLEESYEKLCKSCDILKSKNEFYTQIYSVDGIGTICIDCDKKRHIEWREKNPNKIREYRTKTYFKTFKLNREHNLCVKIAGNIRNRVRMAIKSQKTAKFNNTFELIDCSPLQMVKWLEYHFDSNMTWKNYGIYWQIDHVIPCDFFDLNQREEQLRCFNWRNCRPLEKIKNQTKNNKILPLQIFLQEIRVHYYERHIQIAGKSLET